MKKQLAYEICLIMSPHLSASQTHLLEKTLIQVFTHFGIPETTTSNSQDTYESNIQLIDQFLAAKRIEGCSDNTLKYYSNTLHGMIATIQKHVCEINTGDLRCYLADYQTSRNSSKVILDNIRRIMSSFFTWLEDENLEQLRDQCVHPHKFRRTMATMALEKGMPIEQVQRLLGHAKIDTTLQYAIVNQSNVKIAHRKYMC